MTAHVLHRKPGRGAAAAASFAVEVRPGETIEALARRVLSNGTYEGFEHEDWLEIRLVKPAVDPNPIPEL